MFKMTDKQLEEKIDGFMEDIAMYVHYFHTDPDIDTDQVSYKRDMKAIRIRIEELVEEVEREQFGKARLIGEPFRKTEEDDEHGSYGTSFEN